MARRWLVLVLMLAGGVAEAKHDGPVNAGPQCSCERIGEPAIIHRDGPTPAVPRFDHAVVFLRDSGSELKEIERIEIAGATFSGDTKYVEVEVTTPDGHTVVLPTTPDHVWICDPDVNGTLTGTTLRLTAVDADGNARSSDWVSVTATIDASPQRVCTRRHYGCGMGAMAGFMLGMIFVSAIVFSAIVLLILRALRKPSGAPEDVSLLVGEHLARIVIGQQTINIVFGVVGTAATFALDLRILSLLPILALGFGLIDALVARRALHRLAQPGANALLYDNALVAQDASGSTAVTVSRRTIRRAKERGVASAKVQ